MNFGQESQTENHKEKTYIGFAVKSGKAVYGFDKLKEEKRGVYLVLTDSGLSDGTKKRVLREAARLLCPLIECKDLFSLVGKDGVKVLAVKEANLAAATIKETENKEGYTIIYSEGENSEHGKKI